jgi:hypothetical protein
MIRIGLRSMALNGTMPVYVYMHYYEQKRTYDSVIALVTTIIIIKIC